MSSKVENHHDGKVDDISEKISKLKNKLLIQSEKTRKYVLERQIKRDSRAYSYDYSNPRSLNRDPSTFCKIQLKVQELSKRYINETLNTHILNLVNRITQLNFDESFVKSQGSVHIIILKICKLLLLNEIELCAFSILLDRLSFDEDSEFQLDSYLLVVAVITKLSVSNKGEDIVDVLKEEISDLEYYYNKFLTKVLEKRGYDYINISVSQLNERYEILSKPFNQSCKVDFIDYNYIVDDILQTSLPYTRIKEKNEKHKHKVVKNLKLRKLGSRKSESHRKIFGILNRTDDKIFQDSRNATYTPSQISSITKVEELKQNLKLPKLQSLDKMRSNLEHGRSIFNSFNNTNNLGDSFNNSNNLLFMRKSSHEKDLEMLNNIFELDKAKKINTFDSSNSIMRIHAIKEQSEDGHFKNEQEHLLRSNRGDITFSVCSYTKSEDKTRNEADNRTAHEKKGFQVFAPNLLNKKRQKEN